MTNRLVIASNNRGKIAELTELLAPLGMTPIAQGELGVGEAEEPAVTFVENAILKARHAARETGLPALADDSGLAVDALEGRPGVRSARFAGDDATDQDNVDALLDAMAGRTGNGAPSFTVCWYTCAMPKTRPRSSAMAAGRARSSDPLRAMAASVMTRCSWHQSMAAVRRNCPAPKRAASATADAP